MKRVVLVVFVILPILFCGCSENSRCTKKFESYREELLKCDSIVLTADVEATKDKNVCDYKLNYEYDKEKSTVEVVEPKQISKVKARIDEGETTLEFDGVVIDAGFSVTETISPMTALPTMFEALRAGFIQRSWEEKANGEKLVVTELLLPDDTNVTVWQSNSDMSPRFATLQNDDIVAIKININDFE